MKNKTIVKYTFKYVFAIITTLYVWRLSGYLLTEKNDILNILGFFLYAAIFVSWILVLKSDANKLIENNNTNKK